MACALLLAMAHLGVMAFAVELSGCSLRYTFRRHIPELERTPCSWKEEGLR